MQQLIHSFVSGLPAVVNEITTYYKDKQWQELVSSSHRLKGAGGAFGYPELTEITKSIMEKVKQRNHRELQELIDRLNKRCQQIGKKAS
jgi:HPt (histidine-containing phosphotransfer) domain-containing protein